MSIEKMREEFEGWWREENGSHLYCESAWRGWQASRAALVVELPKRGYWGGYDQECFMEADDVVEAITDAGVKVKP